MITIIAQSHRIARTISYALGADFDHEGYFASDKYFITWTYGHMVEIETPHRDFWLKNKSFPYLTTEFPLSFAPSRHATVRYQADPQLNVIRNLLAKSKKVILATDPTPHGDLMGRYLLRYLNFEGKVVRIALNDLMSETIRNGIFYPTEDKEFTFKADVAELKDRLDWLTNLNISRALGFAVGRNTYQVSRTSLPLLHMVDQREKEIREFSARTFQRPTITIKDNEGEVCALKCTTEWEKIPTEVTETIKPNAEIEVVGYVTEEKDCRPPSLYNIDTLQIDAAHTFGMNPADTYKIARSLYEKKRISFPGCSRGGISRRQFDDFKKDIWPYMKEAACFKKILPEDYRPVFSNPAKNIHGHTHGIILTSFPFVGLSQEEMKIMFLIGRRMLCCFARNFRYSETKVLLQCGDFQFECHSVKVVRFGYSTMAYPPLAESTPPTLSIGQKLTIQTVGMVRRTLSPPKALTDYRLMMQSFKAHSVYDRDSVVKDLIFLQEKGYLVRDLSGEYHLTESGRALCYVTRDTMVSHPGVMRYLEEKAWACVEGDVTETQFVEKLHEFVSAATTELLSSPKLFNPKSMEVLCPKCGNGKIQMFGKIAQCDNPDCNHSIPRQIEGVTLSCREVRNLIADGTTTTIRGFNAPDGKPYCGKVVLDDNFSPVVIKVGK